MENIIPYIGGITFAIGIIITLGVYLYNRNKEIFISPVIKTYSTDIEHSIVDESLSSSYGRAEVILQLNNNSRFNKSIGLKKLEYQISDYRVTDFNNIILDYSIKSSKKIVGGTYSEINQFLLYAVNNSFNISTDEVIIEYLAHGIKIKDSSKINLAMNPGEIKEILKIDFLDINLIEMFKVNNWKYLNVKILFKGTEELFSVKFIEESFQFKMGQFGGGGPITKDNVQNLLIDKNGFDFNTRIITVSSNSQDQFILKLFSPRSSTFNLIINYNNKTIFEDQIDIKVPIYYVRNLEQHILFFDQFSRFMIEKDIKTYNLEEKMYDTSNLNFFNSQDYFFEKDN